MARHRSQSRGLVTEYGQQPTDLQQYKLASSLHSLFPRREAGEGGLSTERLQSLRRLDGPAEICRLLGLAARRVKRVAIGGAPETRPSTLVQVIRRWVSHLSLVYVAIPVLTLRQALGSRDSSHPLRHEARHASVSTIEDDHNSGSQSRHA